VPFALNAGKDIFDVVEAAGATRPEVEAGGAIRRSIRLLLIEPLEAGPQRLVDDGTEGTPLPLDRLTQPRGHIGVQRQCRPHDVLMLSY